MNDYPKPPAINLSLPGVNIWSPATAGKLHENAPVSPDVTPDNQAQRTQTGKRRPTPQKPRKAKSISYILALSFGVAIAIPAGMLIASGGASPFLDMLRPGPQAPSEYLAPAATQSVASTPAATPAAADSVAAPDPDKPMATNVADVKTSISAKNLIAAIAPLPPLPPLAPDEQKARKKAAEQKEAAQAAQAAKLAKTKPSTAPVAPPPTSVPATQMTPIERLRAEEVLSDPCRSLPKLYGVVPMKSARLRNINNGVATFHNGCRLTAGSKIGDRTVLEIDASTLSIQTSGGSIHFIEDGE